jgi:hypothetical protein
MMMTSLEARNLLDKNSLVEARGKSRIFGNIDSDIRLLSTSEIISLVMKSINFFDNVRNLFEKNDTFYETLKRKRGLSE